MTPHTDLQLFRESRGVVNDGYEFVTSKHVMRDGSGCVQQQGAQIEDSELFSFQIL